ncbi:ABC transporter substrate-binding protein [Cohnella sp. GCM10012308]|uniref:ABC transporter substrate-binding protein n=1 Tax=Cohnella sp. GCM10012308 TaxID=3317329 RepID=UPI00360EAE0C
MQKKRVIPLIAAAMLATLAAGCSNSNNGGNAASPATSGSASSPSSASASTPAGAASDNAGKTLTIMMSSGDYGPDTLKTTMQAAADQLGVKIKYDIFPDDQMLNIVNTKLATGNAGDIIIHNFGMTDVSAKDLAPLQGDWVDKITDTTKPLTVNDKGEVLKAPLGGESNMGLLYNKKVLQDAGVTLPIKNYDDFIAAAEKIKAKGVTPVYISNKEVWTAQILLLTTMTAPLVNDESFVDKKIANEAKPSDNPKLAKLFDNVLSLKEKKLINDDYMSATDAMAQEALVNGKAAFYAQMSSTYAALSQNYPDKVGDIGMTYTPLWDDEKDGYVLYGQSSTYMSVSAASENLDLAKQFVSAVLSQPVLTKYYELSPGSAPYKDLGYDLKMSPFNEEMNGYAESLPRLADFTAQRFGGAPKLDPFYGRFNEQIQGLFAGKPVKDTLDAWYKAYADDAKARRLAGF